MIIDSGSRDGPQLVALSGIACFHTPAHVIVNLGHIPYQVIVNLGRVHH